MIQRGHYTNNSIVIVTYDVMAYTLTPDDNNWTTPSVIKGEDLVLHANNKSIIESLPFLVSEHGMLYYFDKTEWQTTSAGVRIILTTLHDIVAHKRGFRSSVAIEFSSS